MIFLCNLENQLIQQYFIALTVIAAEVPADIAGVYIRHKNCLTYENVNDLREIVLCFIIIPAIYLIIFSDFRTESFLFAALALILYQFLNYGLPKLEQERKELWGQDKSFI